MIHWTTKSSLITLSPLLLAVSLNQPAMAMQDDGDQDHQTRIHIEREGTGEGEPAGGHHVMFLGDDGTVQEIEGEGTDFTWIEGEGGRHYRMHGRMHGSMHGSMHGPRLLDDGAFLGVTTTRLTPELRSHFGAPEQAGVMIGKVVENSAAFSAGLRVGDIITSVDGETIESPRDLLRTIRSREEGDAVTVEVYRDGKVQALSTVLGKAEGHTVELGAGRPFGHFRGFPRGMKIDCADSGGDCDIFLDRHLDVCGDNEACDVDISCSDGSCSCTVNGEEADCEQLHPAHRRHLDE